MLDWMKGNEGANATDKVLEPPETPAPVFAIRAFKSALFGTPGAEEEAEASILQSKEPGHQRSKSESTNTITMEKKENANAELDTSVNPSGSPTKSILVTPGTISSRRKTVSFGEGVVDNEGKRESQSSKATKTPPNSSGSLTAQWMSGSADGKPRSKLTQTLMDARENASKNAETATSSQNASSRTDLDSRPQSSRDEVGSEDITLNLDEPRSESGKYWKMEYDNYRVRTNREIKKLIHYRSIAKSYARKKDTEALRLADKLKEEEEKVADMERQVSRLASTIVGQGSPADKEQLIQDLTKQTTLALQYKQQVTSLRKLLESHGVIESNATKLSEPQKTEPLTDEPTNELRESQEELKRANAKIEELKRNNPDLSALRDLAQSSEKKAQELEKENKSLKQTLARVKQEMSRYEGRRKEKESKLKLREAKLETRIQEYRERLKDTTQEHRESEEALRTSFEEERRRMQAQIDLLKMRVTAAERVPTLRPQQRHSFSPRKEYTNVQVYDFAEHVNPDTEDEATEDIEAPPSPSPRSKIRGARHTRNATTGALDLKRTTRNITADDEEVTHYLNEILPRPEPRPRQVELDPLPPSSPPDIGTLKSSGRPTGRLHTAGDGKRTYRSLYLRDPADNEPGHLLANRPRAHLNSTLDTISGISKSRTGTYAGHIITAGERTSRRPGLSDMKSEFIPPERVAAAQSRLQLKHDSRRIKALGKENMRMGAPGVNA